MLENNKNPSKKKQCLNKYFTDYKNKFLCEWVNMPNLKKIISIEIKESVWKNNLFECIKNESQPNNFLSR